MVTHNISPHPTSPYLERSVQGHLGPERLPGQRPSRRRPGESRGLHTARNDGVTPWHLASLRGSEAESRARQRLTANGPCAKDGAGAGGRGSPNARSAEGACGQSRQGAGETPARARWLRPALSETWRWAGHFRAPGSLTRGRGGGLAQGDVTAGGSFHCGKRSSGMKTGNLE